MTKMGYRWASRAGAFLLVGNALVFAGLTARADTVANAKVRAVDALFSEFDRDDSPGVALGIYRDGELVYARGYGRADLESDRPITPRTVFHVASVSKQFTAFAVALLAREGKVDLQADVRSYLPYVPDFGHVITPLDLLHHTSGLRNQWTLFVLAGQDMRGVLRQSQIVNMVGRQRSLDFAPGTQISYSNTGYTLLAEIVRAQSGSTLREFTQERIFKPLGMQHTFFYDDVTQIVPGRALSYEKNPSGTGWRRALLNFENVGATSLQTTVEDLAKWARNFSRPTVGDAALMAQVGTLGKLQDGSIINYGLGISREAFAGHEGLIHLGSDAAYRAVFCYFPAADFGVFILGNTPFDQRRAVASITDIYLNGGTGRVSEIAAPVAAVDGKTLVAAVGSYLSPHGEMVSLTRNKGELQWQVAGESPRTAIFRADGTFDFGSRTLGTYRLRGDASGKIVAIEEWPGWPRPIPSQQRDATGKVTMVADFAAEGASGTILHHRVQPSRPTAAALRDLAGSYRSRELDASYQVSVEQDRLMVRSLWLGEPIAFTPATNDRFDSGHPVLSTLQFFRDARGIPASFKVQGRVRDLVFERESGPVPQFTTHQPELFSAPGALANAWADYDNDGDLDLAVSFKSGEVRLYRNDRGTFVNVGAALGLPMQGDEARGLSWGDYDGDGYSDLYVGTRKVPIASHNLLYRNDAGRRFVQVAQATGVAMPGVSSRQSNWVDYDNDGDLDLFVANRIGENGLFRNDSGSWVNTAKALGLADPRRSVGSCWFDMDQDGDLDLFVANQEGDKDAFYRNDGSRFVDVAPELGMDQPRRRLTEGGVGCAVGDFDNDGDLDLFVAAYGFNLLYRNEDGRFVDVAQSLGITESGFAVGASWGDYDLDGWLDLYVAGYARGVNGLEPKDLLMRNTGSRFEDAVPALDVLNHADHGVQWADFDNDGDLDLSLTDSRDAGSHRLLRNGHASQGAPRALQVTILDRQGRHTRAGAEVRLFDATGKLLGTRLVTTGEGYDSQSVQPVHFGLARTGRVTVEVTFMGAGGRTRQYVRNVDPAQFLGGSVVVRQDLR